MKAGAYLLTVGAAILCAAAEPPAPPAALESYIEDGHFKPGDYAWLKGAFDDATPEERAAHDAAEKWRTDCMASAKNEVRAQLREEGYDAPAVDNILVGPLLCREAMPRPFLREMGTFAAFQQERAVAGPVADTYLAAVRIAEQTAQPRSGELARQLELRPLGEQMLRHAFTWARGGQPDSPDLSPVGQAIFQSRVGQAMAVRDYDNTAWLKGVVAESGWPKISDVGEPASSAAWLMAQHADHDPLFQLQVLRLMEPLVTSGETSAQNYAYLYDRIMLKLAGKQRYATQMTCLDREFVPQPLEDGIDVDANRREAGLPSLKEYQAQMLDAYGPCGAPAGAE